MEGEPTDRGTKFVTRYKGTVVIPDKGFKHIVIEPGEAISIKDKGFQLFESREEQLEAILSYNWITRAESRVIENFINRIDIKGMACPRCDNVESTKFTVRGKMNLGKEKVQRYECLMCGYLGHLGQFKVDIDCMVCPRCENTVPGDLVLRGKMRHKGKIVLVYECLCCNYFGDRKEFETAAKRMRTNHYGGA
jgi:transposase-like protein